MFAWAFFAQIEMSPRTRFPLHGPCAAHSHRLPTCTDTRIDRWRPPAVEPPTEEPPELVRACERAPTPRNPFAVVCPEEVARSWFRHSVCYPALRWAKPGNDQSVVVCVGVGRKRLRTTCFSPVPHWVSAILVERIVLLRVCAVLALTASLVSCGVDAQRPPVELAGKIVWAAALYPDRCDDGACQATYEVRIVNETDTVLYVSQCRVMRPPARGVRHLPIMGLSGLAVRASGTQTTIASSRLPATPSDIHRLTGAALRCFGTDGTGQLVE